MFSLEFLRQLCSRLFSPESSLRRKHEAFKSLLEYDQRSHLLMAKLEKFYYDEVAVDFCSVRKSCEELEKCLGDLVSCLSQMAPKSGDKLREALQSASSCIQAHVDTRVIVEPSPLTLSFNEIPADGINLVGAKAFNLATARRATHLPVPTGFVVTTRAYEHFLESNALRPEIQRRLAEINACSESALQVASEELSSMIMNASLPPDASSAVFDAYSQLIGDKRCAVRSSAVGEDSEECSFAGQYRSILNVSREKLSEAYKQVLASKYSPSALFYRISRGCLDEETPMAVLITEMVDAQSSGVLYTRHPFKTHADCMCIYSVWGLGEPLVAGSVVPDLYEVSRQEGYSILEKNRMGRVMKFIPSDEEGVIRVWADESERDRISLDEADASDLASWGAILEDHFGKPLDIEWCKGHDGQLRLLQVRPLQITAAEVEERRKDSPGSIPHELIFEGGECAAPGIGAGTIYNLKTMPFLDLVPDDSVLVARTTSPSFTSVLNKVKAVITDSGSVAGHFASIARESGIPVLVNTKIATQDFTHGETITVDATEARVYAGIAEELLSRAPEKKRNDVSPFRKRLRNILDHISPLNLVDPEKETFCESNCVTFHDVLRFAHERAVREMISIGRDCGRRYRGAKRLVSDIPISFFVLDLGKGLTKEAKHLKEITEEHLLAKPIKALWKGLTHPEIEWSKDTLHFDWEQFSDLTGSGGICSSDSKGLASLAITSDCYLNANIRFGYHYAIVDCFCGHVLRGNYLSLYFTGGGAGPDGRSLRALFLESFLRANDFSVHLERDSVRACLQKASVAAIEESLELIGQLLAFTPLLDMKLDSLDKLEEHLSHFKRIIS
jgi:pyruvate, water dikinase